MDNKFDTYMARFIGSLKDNLDEVFDKHDQNGNGYIDSSELDGFITDIFSEKLSDDEVKEFKILLLERVDNNNDGRLDKNELKAKLPTEENFLLQFKNVGNKMCGVDFVKIWNHYDTESSGALHDDKLKAFLKDLILKNHPLTSKDKDLDSSVDKLKNCLCKRTADCKGDTDGLTKEALFDLLQVETTCASFQGLSSKDFEDVFSKYDKDNSGVIEGEELVKLLSALYLDENESEVDVIKDVVLLKLDTNNDKKVQKSELKAFLKVQD